MINRIRFFLLLCVATFVVSCKTDFNVIADYKEVAIVYGLLNQNDSIHYLRINKAFLGDGNALTYAQVADSSSFGGNIDVSLTEITPNGIVKTRVFDTITLSSKDTASGDFYAPNQLFYYYKNPANDPFGANSTFKLNIINKRSRDTISSHTELVHNFSITKPLSGAKTLNLKQANKFGWENAVNGRRYQFILYFNYRELSFKGDSTHKKIAWLFPEVIADNILGNGESQVEYATEDFFKFCESNIPYSDKTIEDAVKTRYASSCELEVTVIGDEFNTYLEANGPSTGVLLEKPSYSNITNGIGLFSSRYQIHRAIAIGPETVLDLSTSSTLKFAKPTK